MVATISRSLLNKSWIIHRFLNDSDFLNTLYKNHTMVYYNYSHSLAVYSIASTMMQSTRHDGLCNRDATIFP